MTYGHDMDPESGAPPKQPTAQAAMPFSPEWVRSHCSEPPTSDDVTIAADGTPISSVADLKTFLETINARRLAKPTDSHTT